MTLCVSCPVKRCVSSKIVPLPSGLTDKAEAVRMMKSIVMAFKPLLTDSAAVFTHLNGIAARNIKWKAEYASKGLAVDDSKVELLKWALQGAVCSSVDKNMGELLLECPVAYAAAYDGMFTYGKGKSLEQLKVTKYTAREAWRRWEVAGRSVLRFRYWAVGNEEVIDGYG